MHGFFGSYGKPLEWNLSAFNGESFIKRTFENNQLHLTHVTLDKFLDDKYFCEKDGFFIAVEGVLFEADKPEEAITRYLNGETCFWNHWRGSFAGIFYDSHADKLLIFNDHIASKMLFFSQVNGEIAFASDPYLLAKAIGVIPDNENFLWQLLLYGYSPVGETPFSSIQRLLGGEYISICKEGIKKSTYHHFTNHPNSLSLEENIDRIDVAFRRAVARAIQKNEQYGYTHFLPLSAGLDSRMANCVAHEIAHTPIHNITYSQSAFFDETTPRELAAYWHNEWHFTPLDNGECLRPLDEVCAKICGLEHYSGAAETLYGWPELARTQGGVFITGMVGDIILGTGYTACNPTQAYHTGEGSLVPDHPVEIRQSLPADFEQLYPNREIFYLYVRGFNFANLGSPLIQQHYGESYSPFCDVDLLEAAYATPVEQRWGNRLYDQWILSKYPEMAKWKHNGIYTIGRRPRLVSLFGRAIPIYDVPKRIIWYILKKAHLYNGYKEKKGHSMNPEDEWFAQNESLYQWSEEYIRENMSLLVNFPELQKKAEQLHYGTAMERMQVLTLLACLRQAQ